MFTKALSTMGHVTADTRAKALEVLTAAAKAGHRITVVWGMGGGTEHGSGRALDLMTFRDKAAGDFIASYLWTHRVRLGLRHYIWKQSIRSTARFPGVVRKMEDRGNSTKNHYDHVHVWFNETPAYKSAPAPKPPAVRPSPEVVRGTLRRQLKLTAPTMRGDDVKAVQRVLKAEVDGSYGPKTKAKVLAFQRRYWPHDRDEQDGIVGAKTARALGFAWGGR